METFIGWLFSRKSRAMIASEYKAPWGRLLVVTSTLSTFLLVGVSAYLLAITGPYHRIWNTVVLWIPLLILISAIPFLIRRYRVCDGILLIDRLFWSTKIPLEDLRSVEVMPGAMKGGLRLCGNGGLFSFSGWWWSKRLGRYQPYVTDLGRTVVLRFERRTIVLSPESPDEFARELSTFVTAAQPLIQ